MLVKKIFSFSTERDDETARVWFSEKTSDNMTECKL
jgi:hypothetical protein